MADIMERKHIITHLLPKFGTDVNKNALIEKGGGRVRDLEVESSGDKILENWASYEKQRNEIGRSG